MFHIVWMNGDKTIVEEYVILSSAMHRVRELHEQKIEFRLSFVPR